MAPQWGVHIFSILTGCTVIVTLLRTCTFVRLCFNASLNLHDAMFKGIVHAPIQFFSTNPSGLNLLASNINQDFMGYNCIILSVGRILNRFSKDLAAVDEYLPGFFMNFLQVFSFCLP